jgi:hypothetical protein
VTQAVSKQSPQNVQNIVNDEENGTNDKQNTTNDTTTPVLGNPLATSTQKGLSIVMLLWGRLLELFCKNFVCRYCHQHIQSTNQLILKKCKYIVLLLLISIAQVETALPNWKQQGQQHWAQIGEPTCGLTPTKSSQPAMQRFTWW